MTLYGVIFAALVRKLKALVAEYRKLVAEATAIEKIIVSNAKDNITSIYDKAKAEEKVIVKYVEIETEKLKNDLIDKIAQI